MKSMTIIEGDTVFRWAGGTFITVHKKDRADEHVPDDMIELPESLNKTKATREDIEIICKRYLVSL